MALYKSETARRYPSLRGIPVKGTCLYIQMCMHQGKIECNNT